uniref:Uncharacterized protein n=1 Tax=Arundo donax TaxID=35708 RepID=A0A0A8YM44_ARUDO
MKRNALILTEHTYKAHNSNCNDSSYKHNQETKRRINSSDYYCTPNTHGTIR